MKKEIHLVSWHATLNIWWGQIWRMLLVNVVIYAVAGVLFVILPVIYDFVQNLYVHDLRLYQCYFVLFELVLSFWAGRESLTDIYARFRLVAENKITRRSIFGLDRRIRLPLYFSVWWAQLWRMLLVPAAVVGGSLAALIVRHPHAADPGNLLNPVLLRLSLYAIFVLSFWATRESLGDRYPNFRFITEPRTFYADGA